MKHLIYSTFREGYGTGELIAFLEDYDENTPIYLSFDNGYTYGGIIEARFEEDYGEDGEGE